ncbi:Uncharacterised protein [Vibrio cholerae]|nr:Uncharacterised protein [Vibrio cholerae]CSI68071.1 Uncharacterised protein [Vibrio cholerae]
MPDSAALPSAILAVCLRYTRSTFSGHHWSIESSYPFYIRCLVSAEAGSFSANPSF